MNDPPATQPTPGTSPPDTAPGDDPEFAAVMAGFDPGLHDPGPDTLEHLTEPPWDEPFYPGDDPGDDDDDSGWLAALAGDPEIGRAHV